MNKPTKLPNSFVTQTPSSIDNTSNYMPPIDCLCARCGKLLPAGGGIMWPMPLSGGGTGGQFSASTIAIIHVGCKP